MKCLNCGLVYDEEYSFCPNCGTSAPVAEPISLNPTADKVLVVLKDKLFFVICILITISSAFGVIGGNLPLFEILITIFLWITYSKSLNGEVDSGSLRCVSGTVYAQYIVSNVLCCIIIGCGALISVIFAAVPDLMGTIKELENELIVEFPEIAFLTNDVLFFALKIVGPIIVVAGIIALLVNVFGMRKIHRFIKSVYQGIDFQNPNFENPKAARNWMIVFSVLYVVTAFSDGFQNIFFAISKGCTIIVMILATILISKYFLCSQQEIL